MTQDSANVLTRLARLVAYPEPGYAADLRALIAGLQTGSGAAEDLAAFASTVCDLPLGEQEELFTRTFDLNPVCALEVGWHLYGEDYARGKFLVEMRERLRAHGIQEGGELPDHLALLLALAGEMRGEEADALVRGALIPAVEKMLPALETSASPFLPLMRAIRHVLTSSRSDEQGHRVTETQSVTSSPEMKDSVTPCLCGPVHSKSTEAAHG